MSLKSVFFLNYQFFYTFISWRWRLVQNIIDQYLGGLKSNGSGSLLGTILVVLYQCCGSGIFSQIRFFHPGCRFDGSRNLSIFNPKNWYQVLKNKIRDVYLGSWLWIFFQPWSRGQKSSGSGLGFLIPVPALTFSSFRYRNDKMPDSPASRH